MPILFLSFFLPPFIPVSLSLFLSFIRVAPASRMGPKTYARGAAAKEWSLKTHYRTLCRSFTFPSPRSPILPRHCDASCLSQSSRYIRDRPIVQTIQLFCNQRSTILWARIFVPEDRISRGSFDCTPVRSPVSVVNYFCLSFEPLRLCYQYQVLCNYVT